jgi:hypothetical protein
MAAVATTGHHRKLSKVVFLKYNNVKRKTFDDDDSLCLCKKTPLSQTTLTAPQTHTQLYSRCSPPPGSKNRDCSLAAANPVAPLLMWSPTPPPLSHIAPSPAPPAPPRAPSPRSSTFVYPSRSLWRGACLAFVRASLPSPAPILCSRSHSTPTKG